MKQNKFLKGRLIIPKPIPKNVKITQLVDDGKLKARVSVVFPLAQIKEALQISEDGHTRGKIVLQIA